MGAENVRSVQPGVGQVVYGKESPMRWTVLAMVTLVAAATASGAPIAYEGFNYTTPGTVSGQGDGEGWAAAWTGTDQHDIGSPGLTYTDGNANVLPAEGNHAAGVANETSFRSLDTSLWPAAVKTGSELGAPGAVIWVSFIGQAAEANANQWSGLSLHNAGGGEGMFLGNPYAPTNWGADLKDGGTIETTVAVDQQRFVLVRMAWAADGNSVDVAMWLNPPLDGEAGLASVAAGEKASGTRLSNFTFSQIRMAGNVAHNWDEIRFGTSYRQVVPEPATLLLLGAGALATAVSRRRRKK